MTQFQIHDRVQIIDDEKVQEQLRNQTGIIGQRPPENGKEGVLVKLDMGGGVFIEKSNYKFLKKIAD